MKTEKVIRAEVHVTLCVEKLVWYLLLFALVLQGF